MMKNLTELKSINILAPNQSYRIKGGIATLDESVDIVQDDKRRERPGGGISTH
jgi:hypothetical protein